MTPLIRSEVKRLCQKERENAMRDAYPSLSVHPAGWPFILLFAGVACLFAFIDSALFFVGLLLTVWCTYFFRDPPRVPPARKGMVLSPADGKVIAIQRVIPDLDFGLGPQPCTRVSIFLNVFDVHVNRIPADGVIVSRRYRKGKFINASLDKASEDNERMALALRFEGDHPHSGKLLGFVQIAGLVARRIVCDVQEQESVKAGDRYGIIRFGSRADIYLPEGVAPLVSVGQYMIGGETVIADLTSIEEGAP